MRIKAKIKKSLISTAAFFGISFLSIACIPYFWFFNNGEINIWCYILAALFWINIILGFVSISKTKKAVISGNRIAGKEKIKINKLPGIIRFSFGKKNLILYLLILTGVLVIISDIIFGYLSELVVIPIFALTCFLIVIHSIVDGECFRIYKSMKEGLRDECKK